MGHHAFEPLDAPQSRTISKNVVIFSDGSSQAGGFQFALSLTIPDERPVNAGNK
jgi:hypothetical protein